MQIYLTIAAMSLALLSLVVGTITLVLLLWLSKRLEVYDASIADLKKSHLANTKELGERVTANQILVRKRIDHLEEAMKKHSTRIDLVKTQLARDLESGVQKLDSRISAISPEID